MLEVLGIIMLCNLNKKNALIRGRQPGLYVLLTVLLWIGMEIVGVIIGISADMETGAYVLALVFALTGGLISYLLARYCKPGEFVTEQSATIEKILRDSELLHTPATLEIIRDSSMVGAAVKYFFNLNGQNIGALANGKAMAITSSRRQNILYAVDAYGTQTPPFTFNVEDGGKASIHFKAGTFRKKASVGVSPLIFPFGVICPSQTTN